jgi:ectoine hydroxylase-related dioxygenase (phytanoyl-CoA dioxygenase family)
VGSRELDNWHIDGDYFIHYLDSPNQSLLAIPCIANVLKNGGATYICPDGIEWWQNICIITQKASRRIWQEGQKSINGMSFSGFVSRSRIRRSGIFSQQMTGKCGDVVLMHPLMMHSASRNSLHIPRVITNPFVCLKEPFNFNREDPR